MHVQLNNTRRLLFSSLSMILAAILLAGSFPVLSLAQDDSLSLTEIKRRSLEELMSINITSVSRREQNLSTAPAAIEVITNEEIQHSGATTIPEALRLAPNLQVAQIDARNWAINARGFNTTTSNKLLVLKDGRNVYTPLFSGVFWDVQDALLDDLDRIEVVSGPGASAWGANAVNGVINILSKSAADLTTHGLLVQGTRGTDILASGAIRYGGQMAEDSYYRLYGKYTEHDDSRNTLGQEGNDNWDLTQGGARIDLGAGTDDEITVQGDAYIGSADQFLPANPLASAEDIKLAGGNVIGEWRKIFSEQSDLEIHGYYDYTYRKIPGTFSEILHTLDAEFQHHLVFGDAHNFLWGGEYRVAINYVGNSPVLAFLPEDLTMHLVTGFVQDEILILPDKLRLLLGARAEHNTFSGFEIQPTARLSWSLAQRQVLWGSISRAVRTPSRIDRDFFVPDTAPYFLAGGPGFTAEKLIAAEAGYRIQATDNFHISFLSFYHHYDDLRSVDTARPLRISNNLEADAYGGRITINTNVINRWNVKLGYNHLQKFVRVKPGAVDFNNANGEGNDPKHQIFFNSNVDIPGGFVFNTLTRYVSELPVPNQRVPAYVSLDATLAWNGVRGFALSVTGRNLLQTRHAEFGSNALRREALRAVRVKFSWTPQ